jgi:hypothetical protein
VPADRPRDRRRPVVAPAGPAAARQQAPARHRREARGDGRAEAGRSEAGGPVRRHRHRRPCRRFRRGRRRSRRGRRRSRRGRPAPAPAATRRRGRGQSIGSPWSGQLQGATRLSIVGGAYLRRPHRAFGTKTTVDHIRRAVRATRAAFPRTHTLAIGDLSAPNGGWISEHSSHRSGRDVDLGLFYKRKPAGYPQSFVRATDANLDRAATWALLANLLTTHGKDGGVQIVFLDYGLQGLLYRWAQARGVKPRVLDQIFQYPRGRGTGFGIVHHEPNHDNHLHVRFRCAKADADCY